MALQRVRQRGITRRLESLPYAATWLLASLTAMAAAGCGSTGPELAPGPSAGGGEPNATVAFPETWRYPAGRAPVLGRSGMVVTTDSLASDAGLSVLKSGGNAFDAAIATHFALVVVQPSAGNIGGGGFVVARSPDDARFALDFREKAPAAATRDMYLDENGDVTDDRLIGHLASGVPGSVAGMWALWERYGTRPWAELLEPAIRLARDGFVVAGQHSRSIEYYADQLRRFPASAEVFLPGDRVPQVGDRRRQPDLARTLQAIAEDGPDAFYHGWIADSLVAEMRRGGGIISREDLASYRPEWRNPVEVEYRGYRLLSMPPSSSGGVTLGELLNIVEGFDLGSLEWHSAEAIHLAVEAMRRAYADRNFYLGDTDFVSVPLDLLLSQEYADSLRRTIDPRRASSSEDFNKVPLESTETTHYSIVDSEGNAVAATTTLNGGYGSKVVVRGAGFVLNNEMDDFTSKPGVPNVYGLVQGTANAIEPGKRMLSAMTPTIVISPEGRTELLTGTPGGATIISTIFQIVTNHIDFGISPTESVDAPRFHHQHLPDLIRYEEGGLPAAVVEQLRALGHELSERSGISGDVMSIQVLPDGTLVGAADQRRDGMALGY